MTYDLILSDENLQNQNVLQSKVDRLTKQKRNSLQSIDKHIYSYQQQIMIPTPTSLYADAKVRDIHTSRRDPHKKSSIQRYNQQSSKNRANGSVDNQATFLHGKENQEFRLKNYTKDGISSPMSYNESNNYV